LVRARQLPLVPEQQVPLVLAPQVAEDCLVLEFQQRWPLSLQALAL
jgi:hypothetical protein